MTGMVMEFQRRGAERQIVALLDHHVAFRHPRRRPAAAAGRAADLLDHLPILLSRADTRARCFLDSGRAAEVVEVAVADEDVLDVLEVEAERPDVIDHMTANGSSAVSIIMIPADVGISHAST